MIFAKEIPIVYAFDIDGTICTNTDGNYTKAQPYENRIMIVNHLYHQGNTILLFTARGSGSGIKWKKFTKKQLDKWGVFYHKLIMGKPEFDMLIDDKAMSSEQFFNKLWQ